MVLSASENDMFTTDIWLDLSCTKWSNGEMDHIEMCEILNQAI